MKNGSTMSYLRWDLTKNSISLGTKFCTRVQTVLWREKWKILQFYLG